ncbi:MAG: T9SS type A sorting domain-containing protein [Ignavibacteriaceae bacterium]|nr:T9SS type A sorting domain-containing protein [Ignavibacteriaceae bacterium]
MKKVILPIMFTLFLAFTLFAQNVPNGGFESWTSGNPDNWFADNIASIATPVTQSTTAHSGSYSAKGAVINTIGGLIGPGLLSGPGGGGFAITQRFKTVTGYYQLNPVQGDNLILNFILFKSGSPIGTGEAIITAAATSWTQFSIDFIYITSDIPDNCILQFAIAGPTSGSDYHLGTYFLLDDVNLTGTATSVNDKIVIPAQFSLEQNYPNPFNPSTKIQYNIPQNSFVSLKIYNALGMEVATPINGVIPAGTHEVEFDASNLNSGVYFYTLKAGDHFVQTRKMILIK